MTGGGERRILVNGLAAASRRESIFIYIIQWLMEERVSYMTNVTVS